MSCLPASCVSGAPNSTVETSANGKSPWPAKRARGSSHLWRPGRLAFGLAAIRSLDVTGRARRDNAPCMSRGATTSPPPRRTRMGAMACTCSWLAHASSGRCNSVPCDGYWACCSASRRPSPWVLSRRSPSPRCISASTFRYASSNGSSWRRCSRAAWLACTVWSAAPGPGSGCWVASRYRSPPTWHRPKAWLVGSVSVDAFARPDPCGPTSSATECPRSHALGMRASFALQRRSTPTTGAMRD